MRDLRLVSLTPHRIDQAFPLMQAVRPELSLEDWRRHAQRVLDDDGATRSGIATLQDERGLIVGLFVYSVDADPDHGPTLVASDFVAMDIVGPHHVAQALADALETVAREHGCQAVHTSVPYTQAPGSRQIVDLLREMGHRMESFQLCKPVPATG